MHRSYVLEDEEAGGAPGGGGGGRLDNDRRVVEERVARREANLPIPARMFQVLCFSQLNTSLINKHALSLRACFVIKALSLVRAFKQLAKTDSRVNEPNNSRVSKRPPLGILDVFNFGES